MAKIVVYNNEDKIVGELELDVDLLSKTDIDSLFPRLRYRHDLVRHIKEMLDGTYGKLNRDNNYAKKEN